LIFSLCNRALRKKFSDPNTDEAQSEQALKPLYVFRPEAAVRKDLRTFDRRLRDRFVAADMAIVLLKDAIGALPSLPEGLGSLSLNALSTWASGLW
jgi:hypothetical protein